METKDLQTLGRILKILRIALDESECKMTTAEFEGFSRMPSKYFAPIIMRVNKFGALTKNLDEQLGVQISFLNEEVLKEGKPLSIEEQGILQIAYWQYDNEQMSLKEASEYAGVSENAIRDAIKTDKIKGYKIGNKYRLFKKSVETYKKGKR